MGTQAFYTNIEVRFPLIDYLAIPFMQFANIRGNIFLDVGGAYYHDFNEDLQCYDSDDERSQRLRGVLRMGYQFSSLRLGGELGFRQAVEFQRDAVRRF